MRATRPRQDGGQVSPGRRRTGLLPAGLGLLLASVFASAHTPHDPVSHLALSDAYEEDRTAFIVVNNELKRSVDGGGSWQRLERGLSGLGLFTGLAVSPHFSRDRTVIAARRGEGLFLTRDGGDHWQRLAVFPRGSGRITVRAGRVAPTAPACFAATTKDDSIAFSADGGATWEDIPLPAGPLTAMSLACGGDRAVRVAVGRPDGTVMYSHDRGVTWHRMPDVLAGSAARFLDFSSEVAEFLVGATGSGAVFRWHLACSLAPACAEADVEELAVLDDPISTGVLGRDSQGTMVLTVATEPGAVVSGPLGETWASSPVGSVPFENQALVTRSPQISVLAAWRSGGICAGSFGGFFCRGPGDEDFVESPSILENDITGLAVAPEGGGDLLAVATFYRSGWVSDDRAESWSALPSGAVSTHFLNASWPPAHCGFPGPVFVGREGLIWHDPAASQWTFATPSRETTLLDRVENRIRRLAGARVAPHRRAKVYGTFATALRERDECHILMGTRYEGLWSYRPSTGDWSHLGPVYRRSRVEGLVTDYDARGYLASLLGEGIFELGPDGEWSPLMDGLPDNAVKPATLGIFKSAKLALLDGERQWLLYGSPAGLYRWNESDGWDGPMPVVDGDGQLAVDLVRITADTDGHPLVLVSVRGFGLFWSRDPAAGFAPATLRNTREPVMSVRYIDRASDAGPIFAAGPERVFVSEDAGRTWIETARP